MGKTNAKNLEKINPFVSPAKYSQQPVGLYDRMVQMKSDNTPLLRRKKASEVDNDMISSPDSLVQTKLDVVQPDDPSEKEADSVADQVVRSPDSNIEVNSAKSRVNRESSVVVNRKGRSSKLQDGTAGNTESYINNLSGGQPLSKKERDFFEPRFGADFSNVRIHNDERAQVSADSINAKAYTKGNNIVFGSDQYSPNSPSGRHLMAHELTHTIQQGNGVQRDTIQRDALDVNDPLVEARVNFIQDAGMEIVGIYQRSDPEQSVEFLIKGNRQQWRHFMDQGSRVVIAEQRFFDLFVQPFLSTAVSPSYATRYMDIDYTRYGVPIPNSLRIDDNDIKEFLWALYGDMANSDASLMTDSTYHYSIFLQGYNSSLAEFVDNYFYLIIDELIEATGQSTITKDHFNNAMKHGSNDLLQAYMNNGIALMEIGMLQMGSGLSADDHEEKERGEEQIKTAARMIASARMTYKGRRDTFKENVSGSLGFIKSIVGKLLPPMNMAASLLTDALLSDLTGKLVNGIVNAVFNENFDYGKMEDDIDLFTNAMFTQGLITNTLFESAISSEARTRLNSAFGDYRN